MAINSILRQVIDGIRLLPLGGPGICSILVTNVCNANCDFCNFARDKTEVQEKVWVDADQICQAIDILYERGIRYLIFTGGEPTLHPKLQDMIRYGAGKGMRPSLITNGSRLTPALLRELDASGVRTLYISLDAASAENHETNRGLPDVCERIAQANRICKDLSIRTVASVTINKLIQDFTELLTFIKQLGFDTVNFCYPARLRGSTFLAFSQTSTLIDYTPQELIQALETVKSLKGKFDILNSRAALAEMVRFLKKDKQQFACYGGYKYFHLDYHLDIYRCNDWPTKICSIFEFRDQPFIRDNCTKCMSGCYRDASVLLHSGVSVGDAIQALRQGRLLDAMRHLGKPTNFLSLKTLVEDWGVLRQLAKVDAPKATD